MRVDNGAPWVLVSDLPAPLALWWQGLGVGLVQNHPHCPRENAKVERCNGLVGTWGDPTRCADFAAWQAHLNEIAHVQREEYPALPGGQTRMQAHPELAHSGRPYSQQQELQQWRLQGPQAYLAQGRWPRRVSKIGQVTLYGKPYRAGEGSAGAGRKLAGQDVWLSYEPTDNVWVLRHEDGHELARHPAEQITTERICALDICQERPPSRKSPKPRARELQEPSQHYQARQARGADERQPNGPHSAYTSSGTTSWPTRAP